MSEATDEKCAGQQACRAELPRRSFRQGLQTTKGNGDVHVMYMCRKAENQSTSKDAASKARAVLLARQSLELGRLDFRSGGRWGSAEGKAFVNIRGKKRGLEREVRHKQN